MSEELSMLSITPEWAPEVKDNAARDWWDSDILIERLLSRTTMSLITVSAGFDEGNLWPYLFPQTGAWCWKQSPHGFANEHLMYFCAERRPRADLWNMPPPVNSRKGKRSWLKSQHSGFRDLERTDVQLHRWDMLVPRTRKERGWVENWKPYWGEIAKNREEIRLAQLAFEEGESEDD
jgi:hypothetical protein